MLPFGEEVGCRCRGTSGVLAAVERPAGVPAEGAAGQRDGLPSCIALLRPGEQGLLTPPVCSSIFAGLGIGSLCCWR